MRGNAKGPVAWFVHNHVAANLLMVMVLVLGGFALMKSHQEVFPEVDLDMIEVSVEYPGASPEEVEEAICVRIEEQVASVEGVKSIISRASEGRGVVTVELEQGVDPSDALDDVKTEVDRIDTFPDEAEEPLIVERTNRRQVINLVIYGDADERTLKVLADNARNQLTALPNISQAELSGVRDYEISIEVSEETLRRYGLTFDQVSRAVSRSSLDLPAGSIKTDSGEILLRTKGQRYTGPEFERIILLTRADGSQITLGQVARVIDGFDEDAAVVTRYDGNPAAMVQVFRVGEQDAIDVSDTVKRYVEEESSKLPAGVRMDVWQDSTDVLKSRRDLLLRNGTFGLILVFTSLLLFLDLRLSLWVASGIVVSFLGAFWFLPFMGTTINLISLFAFIMSLGIVVDDAIVVGENIYSHWEEGKSPFKAAIDGATEMVMPVTFSILTTVAAFMPLLFVEGTMGKFMRNIPTVVITVLMLSLLESVFILPAHLSARKGSHHKHGEQKRPNPLERLRRSFGRGLDWFINGPYEALLRFATRYRYVTVALFVVLMMVTVAYVKAGKLKFSFFPDVESDRVQVRLAMPNGTAIGETLAVASRIEAEAKKLQKELELESGSPVISHIYTVAGAQTVSGGPVSSSPTGTNIAEVAMQLTPSEARTVESSQVASRLRELVGPVPNAESLTYSANLFGGSNGIEIQLTGDDFDTLQKAAERLKAELATYQGVGDIEDSFRQGKMEVKLQIKPEAQALGLTLADLARQVRQGYHGDEALRIQRGRDDVKVMVRYPRDERRSLGDLENMRIRTPSGEEVPFSQVAVLDMGRGYASINRQERKRVISVSADVDEKITEGTDSPNAKEIVDKVVATFMGQLMADYPGLGYAMEGREKDRAESIDSLKGGFLLALIAIYILLAVPFKAYTQPLVVMSAIPFGIVGAVWGHVLVGLPMTILSLFGVVALSGVVVNDSLIMVDYINRAREAGTRLHDAVMSAGVRRFRPIILTTLTTFLGLTPMLLEKSVQAQFLIPMAVSLAFGVATATSITLLLVPTLYTILEDVMKVFGHESDRWKVDDDDGGGEGAGAGAAQLPAGKQSA